MENEKKLTVINGSGKSGEPLSKFCDFEEYKHLARNYRDHYADKEGWDLYWSCVINSGMYEGFRKSYLSNYELYTREQKKVWVALYKYVMNNFPHKIVIFYGNPGTGKTHLACALLHNYMWIYKKSAKYVQIPDLLLKIRNTYGKGKTETEQQVLNYYRKAPLVCIDELGVEKRDSEFSLRTLYSVLSHRYENGKPTILITNLDDAELHTYIKNYHERLFSRIAANTNLIIGFGWEDYRLRSKGVKP